VTVWIETRDFDGREIKISEADNLAVTLKKPPSLPIRLAPGHRSPEPRFNLRLRVRQSLCEPYVLAQIVDWLAQTRRSPTSDFL